MLGTPFFCAVLLVTSITPAHALFRKNCVSALLRQEVDVKSVANKLDPEIGKEIYLEISKVVNQLPNRGRHEPLKAEEFNGVLQALLGFAERHGIRVTETTEILGVYPKGLNEIKVSGLKVVDKVGSTIGFAKQHELAHLFHTLFVRANLKKHLASDENGNPRASEEELTLYVEKLEDGFNYLEFEKAVTGLASIMTKATGAAKDSGRYQDRLNALLTFTQAGLYAGKIRFPSHYTSIEDIYGVFLSRVPIVMGKSGKQAVARLPFIMFCVVYALNPPVRSYGIDPDTFGLEEGSPDMKFRDFVHGLAKDKLFGE